jgi:hypothetical protein
LPILLPSMVEAENFSDHPRTGSCLGLRAGLDGGGKSRPTCELCSVVIKKALERFTLLISNSESSSF